MAKQESTGKSEPIHHYTNLEEQYNFVLNGDATPIIGGNYKSRLRNRCKAPAIFSTPDCKGAYGALYHNFFDPKTNKLVFHNVNVCAGCCHTVGLAF